MFVGLLDVACASSATTGSGKQVKKTSFVGGGAVLGDVVISGVAFNECE